MLVPAFAWWSDPAVLKVSLLCFAASYAMALALEVWHYLRPRPVLHYVGLTFGGAGLLAQTIYLAYWQPPLGWQFGTLLALAWILAIFYLFGALHHRRQPWGLFVLPVILGMVGVATLFGPPLEEGLQKTGLFQSEQKRVLGIAHASLVVLAAVGVCVAFVASLMYLVQAQRLKDKQLPRTGPTLPSLERLESMNRRALNLAFPLLTIGMLFGVALMVRHSDELGGWTDPRVLSTVPLVLTLAILLYLRSIHHLRGRRVALLTIMAFGLLLVTLVLPHMGRGGPP